jgi:hypothetical protein
MRCEMRPIFDCSTTNNSFWGYHLVQQSLEPRQGLGLKAAPNLAQPENESGRLGGIDLAAQARPGRDDATSATGGNNVINPLMHCQKSKALGLLIGRHGQNLSAFTFEGEHLDVLVLRMWFPSDEAHGPLTSRAIGVASWAGGAVARVWHQFKTPSEKRPFP